MNNQQCYKCVTKTEHPWHDSGVANMKDMHLWEKEGDHGHTGQDSRQR